MLSTWHSVTHETGKGKKDSPREAREVCDLGTELGTLCSRVPHITLKIICKENQTIPKQQRDQLCRATCSTDSDPGPEYGLLRPGLFVQSDLCHMERLDQGFSTCRVQTNKQTNLELGPYLHILRFNSLDGNLPWIHFYYSSDFKRQPSLKSTHVDHSIAIIV